MTLGRMAAWTTLLLSISCGCPPAKAGMPPEPNAEEAHESAHHGTLVHRFDDPAYFAQRWEGPERDARQRPAEVIALLRLSPGMTVVDLGAGTGYFAPHLGQAVGSGGHVLALDVEPGMVRWVIDRAARESLANVEARLVAQDDPLLGPASVDRILIVNTWHHIGARETYAKKLRDALRPGGFVLLVDFTLESEHGPPREHRIPPAQAIAELAAAGLDAVLLDEALPDQYVVSAAARSAGEVTPP